MTPDLSIVIVSWNTKALLKDCLESIQNVAHAEVFVADNASSDGSPELVASEFPNVTLIQTGANLGFAKANNLALKQAKGRYWLLLNSDTLVPDGALEALVAAMDTHPEAAVAGSLLLNGDGSLQHSWARFPSFQSELSGALERSQCPYTDTQLLDEATRASLAPFACDWVGGAVFCVRASAAQKAGLLDEKFFMYSEETEWCHRLKKQTGGTTLLVPASVVIHLGGGSSRAVPKATRQRMWRSSLRFFQLTQDPLGALLPCVVATGRYLLSPLRRTVPRETTEKDLTLPQRTLFKLNPTDPMTGLKSLQSLRAYLQHPASPLALYLLDLDDFKKFHDHYGHHLGDEFLVHVAKQLKLHCPQPCEVFRFGGEEFVIAFPTSNKDEIESLGKTLLSAISLIAIRADQKSITISIGIAILHCGEAGESLMRRAEMALHEAKRQGKNRICWAEEPSAATEHAA